MGSENNSIPFIDLSKSDVQPGSAEWNSIKNHVRQALVEYGCFESSFDQAAIELGQEVIKALKELFELPLETKLANYQGRFIQGYIGQHPAMPRYQSMGIDDPTNPEKVESVTKLLWPEGNTSFSKTILSYSEKISEFDGLVRRIVLECFGVEKYLDEILHCSDYHLRLIEYQAPNGAEAGLSPHHDMGMVTVLYQSQVNGLEVLKDGQWIKCSPNNFIVMTADSFHAWTNGRLHSPYHRVRLTENVPRYALALHSLPRAGYIIKAPEELIDEEHPLLFKPFDCADYIAFHFNTGAGHKKQSAIKAFCGIQD